MLLQPSALAQSPQCWILPQPKYSNLRRNQVWFHLQLTAQYQFPQTSSPCSPSTNCSPKTHQKVLTVILDNSTVAQQRLFSPPRLRIIPPHQPLFIETCCASSPGSSPTYIILSNKLVKHFSCLLSVILHVGQIYKEHYDSY
ncbi:hypothetical protein ATANTOWER_016514 [Ataeniobius toweri]|uniref:Uncharacterized protein n=1 Tax=Ataeniobius toweri TaxID=208326 RepID=A0ABU7AGM9_9TELE|nr:hypothetical protein [Ataeniobius toweri]